LFRVGGRTDMTKLIVAFRNSANESENGKVPLSTNGISLQTEGQRKQRWRNPDHAGRHSG